MWGKPGIRLSCCGTRRTIPTHVGKTGMQPDNHSQFADHPHACGENIAARNWLPRHWGPSPRMWGKRITGSTGCSQHRTIPTHVGKTNAKWDRRAKPADHPHACGENCLCIAAMLDMPGPSPRMWGKQPKLRTRMGSDRTIPTHVGKTTYGRLAYARNSDHPHACGENTKLSMDNSVNKGKMRRFSVRRIAQKKPEGKE